MNLAEDLFKLKDIQIRCNKCRRDLLVHWEQDCGYPVFGVVGCRACNDELYLTGYNDASNTATETRIES